MIEEEAIIVEILHKAVQFAGVCSNAVQEVVVPHCVELQSYTHEIYVWMVVPYPQTIDVSQRHLAKFA